MIKSVTVTNHIGDRIKMELARPESSGFAVTSIRGLGAVKADINMTDLSTYDGSLYNSSRLGTRNIVLDIIFIDGYGESIEDLRHKAYKLFQTKSMVNLRFETSNRTVEADGYVETNEPTIFSSMEGCQISIICPSPYLYGVGEDNIAVFSSIEPKFEFPFSNESLTEPLLEMGSIKTMSAKAINYKGDAEIGLKITFHAYGEVGNITMYNTGTRESMKIDTDLVALLTGSGIVANDEIIINTVKGDKYIWLLREGLYYNILNSLDKNADWFQLQNGDNIFAYTAEYGVNNLKCEIQNRVIYKGV